MAKPLVWTLRVMNAPAPFFWLTHEGPQSAAFIERVLTKLTQDEEGPTVVVGLASGRMARRPR